MAKGKTGDRRVKQSPTDQAEGFIRRSLLAPDPLSPLPKQAEELALMLQTGVEPFQALAYFFDTAQEVDVAHEHWIGHRLVHEAFARFNKGEWQHLSTSERIELSLNKHYAEMAYFLWTHHYAEVWGKEAEKANTCRTALEAKLAGTAGLSPLERFWQDFVAADKVRTPPDTTETLLEGLDPPDTPQ